MTTQKQAADLCQRDIGRHVACTNPANGITVSGVLNALETTGHAVRLWLAGAIKSLRLLPGDVVEVTGAAPPVGPDCLHGKHRACDARALDPATDDIVRCACNCHAQEETP